MFHMCGGCSPEKKGRPESRDGGPAGRRRPPKPLGHVQSDPQLWTGGGGQEWQLCDTERAVEMGVALSNGSLLVFRYRQQRNGREGSFSSLLAPEESPAGLGEKKAEFECQRVPLPSVLGESLRADDSFRDEHRWTLAFQALSQKHPRTAAIAVLRLSRQRTAYVVWAPFKDQMQLCALSELTTCAPYTIDRFVRFRRVSGTEPAFPPAHLSAPGTGVVGLLGDGEGPPGRDRALGHRHEPARPAHGPLPGRPRPAAFARGVHLLSAPRVCDHGPGGSTWE